MKGFIYIASNPSLKVNMLKIGWTRNIDKRMKQISGTNIPDHYKLEASYSVIDMDKAEKKIFKTLKNFRYKVNREFFIIELNYAKFICKSVSEAINKNKIFDLTPIVDDELNRLESRYYK